METEYLQDSLRCITCNTELQGDYCYKCGEKKIVPAKDNSLLQFIEQALDGLTHLDSKVIKSFWLLFSKPGFLAAEYNKGRRKPYMKPIQLFVVASVLFYLVFPSPYLFFSSIINMKTGYEQNMHGINVFHYNIGGRIHQIASERKISEEQIETETFREAAHKSKEFLFLILPFFALMVYVLFRRASPYYVPHLILTVYLFSFFIITNLLAVSIMTWLLGYKDLYEFYFNCMSLVFLSYMVLSVRKVYKCSWFLAILKSVIMLIWFILLILVYRQVITIWAVNAI